MITKRTKYALKALLLLGEKSDAQNPVLISNLAKEGRIPRKFLELILLDLKNKGVLQSRKGKGGGYFLAKPADKIQLSTILRILEGPLAPLPCLSKTSYRKCDDCHDEGTCAIRLTMKKLYEQQLVYFEETTLQNMLEHESSDKALSYAI